MKRLDWGCQINSQQTKKRTEFKKGRISLNQRPFVEDKAQDFGILVASAELFIAICRHSSGRDSLTFRLAFDNDAIRLEDDQAPPWYSTIFKTNKYYYQYYIIISIIIFITTTHATIIIIIIIIIYLFWNAPL